MLKHITVISLILLTCHPALSQKLNFRTYGVNEGLAQSQVQAIVQDDDGYLWFGTGSGLSKFNGNTFENFNIRSGISGNFVTAGFKDSKGNLWFGHSSGKITLLDRDTQKFVMIDLQRERKFSSAAVIESIFQTENGDVWIASDGWGFFRIRGKNIRQFTSKDGLISNKINTACITDDGKLWFGTSIGISIFSPRTSSFDSLTTDNGLFDNYVTDLLSDRNGNVWITSADTLLMCRTAENKIINYTQKDGLPANQVWYVFEDSDGNIWCSDFGRGIFRFKGIQNELQKLDVEIYSTVNGLASNSVNCFAEDSEGNLWMGTDGNGVSQLRDDCFEFYGPAEGFPDHSVWSIALDKKKQVWLGTEKGLTRLRPKKTGDTRYSAENISVINGETISDVFDSFMDDKDDLWFLSLGTGVLKWDSGKESFSKFTFPDSFPGKYVYTMAQDEQDNYWFGSVYYGLMKYDQDKKHYQIFDRKNSGISSDSINTIFKSSSGYLWIGTDGGGLVKFDGRKFESYSGKNGHPVSSVISIAEDNDQHLWLVTKYDELFHFDGTRFYNYSNLEGMDGGAIYSVLSDDHNNIWLGTNNGLACLDRVDSCIVQYSGKKGWPLSETNENATLHDRFGNLWFGAVNGVLKVKPALLSNSGTQTTTMLTKLQVFLKDAPFPENNTFSSARNYLTFHFNAINFSYSEDIEYQYKLDGFDRNWSPKTQQNHATYSNLPAGSFAFRVRSKVPGGQWNDLAEPYQFEILQPFYKTTLFYFLLIFVGACSVFVYIRLRIRKIQTDKLKLEHKVMQRTRELQIEKENAEKTNIALRESEAKFRVFTEATSSAILIYKGSDVVYVNPASEDITGYTSDELCKMKFWEIIHPDYRKFIGRKGLSRSKGNEKAARYEFKIVRKNGQECWLDFTAQNIEFEGSVAGLGTAFDITERKMAEEALLAEKERLAVTLRSIGDGVITTNVKGEIILISKAAERILGYPDGSYIGQPASRFLGLSNIDESNDPVQPISDMISTSGTMASEQVSLLVTASGEQRLVTYNGASLRDKSGSLIGTVFVFRDITEKHRLEQEMIKNQKLESIGLLAGGIAHDFNNILTAIVGNLSLGRMFAEPGSKVLDRIERTEKAAGRAQELTQQLLTFAKGGAPVKKEAQIGEIINESVSFILSGSNVSCTLDFDKPLWIVNVDSGQISQVVQNLVINADQAMPDGGKIDIHANNVEVDSSLGLPLNSGDYVRIRIEDNGIGINQKHLERIFDPFFTTKQSGSGLGLASAYSIITKHLGHITVNSVLGKGTVFTIYLPALKDASVGGSESQLEQPDYCFDGRVLLMDDEELVLETAGAMLSMLGLDVQYAIDGQEAINSYSAALGNGSAFDLVIMDLTIPGGMGGKQAVKKLMEIDPQITAIVSSGYSSDPVMANYQQYGFKGCLKKPFKFEEIGQLLSEIKFDRKATVT